MNTYPNMDAKIVGILRTGEWPSQYAAQRIEELEAENERLEAKVETMERHGRRCQTCLPAITNETERLQVWKGLAFSLWQQLSADSTDDIAKRAISKFMQSVDCQIECEQEAAKEA